MTKELKREHKGIGGLYFLFTNIICSVIMITVLHLSWSSQVIAIADNLAYMVAINLTVRYHIANMDSFSEAVNPTVLINNEEIYDPLTDFNNMILTGENSTKLATERCKRCVVSWDKERRSTKVQFGEFKTILNINVTPHEQNAVIEDY